MPFSRTSLLAALAAAVLCWGAAPAAAVSVDDFENGLPAGTDGVFTTGFLSFEGGGGAATIATTATTPAPVPGAAAGNQVLRMDVDTTSFAGFVHVFETPVLNTLTPRNWSSFDAITLWLYGSNTGNDLYIDVLDNYDVAGAYPFEIWTSAFKDDFSGWKQLSFAFSGLTRKEIGNGAPNDGLGLSAVHGWALGTLATGGAQTYYVDDVQVVSSVPEPGTLALMCAALLVVMGAALRRRPLQR